MYFRCVSITMIFKVLTQDASLVHSLSAVGTDTSSIFTIGIAASLSVWCFYARLG